MDNRERLVSNCDVLRTTTEERHLHLEISTLTIKKETAEGIDDEESPVNDYMYPYGHLESTECVNHYDNKDYVLQQVGKQFSEEECPPQGGSDNSKIVAEDKELLKVIDKQKVETGNTSEGILFNMKTEVVDKNYEITIKMETSEEQEILDNSVDTNTQYDMLLTPQEIQCNSSDTTFRKNFNSFGHNCEHIKVEINSPGVNEINELYHCQYCDKHFDSYDNLLTHISDVHKTANPKCELCGKQFKSEKNLERHILVLHKKKKSPEGVTPNSVEYNADFKQEYSLNEHIKLCRPGFEIKRIVHKCEFCERIYKSKQTLTMHIKRMHYDYGKTFDCWCGKEFRSPLHLRKHKKMQHESKFTNVKSEYKCKRCEAVFKIKQGLKDHMKGVHYKNGETFKCWCGRQFYSSIKLSAHESLRHYGNQEQFQCDSCGKIFKRKAHLVNHIKRFHYDYGRSFECFCGEQFCSPILLNQHRRRQHDPKPDRVRCDTCHKSFKSKSSLALHERRVHYDYGRLFECFCGKQFRSPLYLNQHKKLHERKAEDTDKGRFQCDLCKKFFKKKPYLVVHIKKYHYDYGRLFECFCGEQFYSPMLLNQHKRRRHNNKITNTDTLQCTTCQKLFNTKVCLMAHVKRMHYDYGRTFECWCGKQCRTPLHLQEHKRLRHYRKMNNANNELYQCDSCQKLFKKKQCLVVHIMRIHYDYGKTFECWCGKQFRSPIHLKIHKKARHGQL